MRHCGDGRNLAGDTQPCHVRATTPTLPFGTLPAMNAQQMWREVWTNITRVTRSDLQRVEPSPEERARLEKSSPPVNEPLVQRYAVWRKAVLWLATVFIAAQVIFEIISFSSFASQAATGAIVSDPGFAMASDDERDAAHTQMKDQVEQSFGSSNLALLDGLNWFMILSSVAGLALFAMAAWKWHDVGSSRRWARAGWLVIFITPFALSLLPVTSMINWEDVDPGMRQQLQPTFGVVFALGFFMVVGPKAISLFPGIMRSSMTLKTMLPEAATPGWATVLAAPLYALFFIVIASTIIQMQGSLALILGIICFMAAPIVYLWKARDLIEPQTPERAATVIARVRLVALIFNLLGVFLLAIFFFDVLKMGVLDVLKFGISVLAGVIALTVVASDFVVALLWTGYQQSRAFHGTALQQSLETKYQALENVGVTLLRSRRGGTIAVSAPPPPPTT